MLKFIENDAWLHPVADKIEKRYSDYQNTKKWLEKEYGSVHDFADAYQYYGLHHDKKNRQWVFREWLPNAKSVFLTGDFNMWDCTSHPLHRIENGNWEITMPENAIKHGDRYKLYLHDAKNQWTTHLPAYTFYTEQDETSKDFSAKVFDPDKLFAWGEFRKPVDLPAISSAALPANSRKNPSAKSSAGSPATTIATPFIYEAHIGMAQEKEGIGTYREFADNILPRIKKLGYNTVQIMGIAEHPYYGSFGYHVSNFYAPSSRFGTPDDLKYLVRKAHRLGLSVLLDLVHAHFVENVNEGLNNLDGSDALYNYAGANGTHPHWGSKIFDYGKNEVRRFLLSNIRYWMEEFCFDGFRFDGVTSMLYFHRGYVNYFGTYENYFGGVVDNDAIIYLSLANDLIHSEAHRITIAEEVSGMPGITVTTADGGIGFDYRLSMGIPDFWIKIIKERSDENWIMGELWRVLNDRIPNVPQIAYCESHDQALVGDKTLAFRLMDAAMYTSMNVESGSPVVSRGIALHKMIRLFTLSIGANGGGYLNFMGNEFGHPEWIDFPREGNGWSFKYARRQWSLADTDHLKYSLLEKFDKAMLELAKQYNPRSMGYPRLLHLSEDDKTIVFSIDDDKYIFVFNWHTSKSIPDYAIKAPRAGKYSIVLNSDELQFGGYNRITGNNEFFTTPGSNGEVRLKIYNINRAVVVYKLS
ncbi:MAG: alpha amylase C-terminal domain-containing protein [Bacteroidales bacterium]|jgi:1,4-alpha-glucan branching enzyme|nr:alpha amylase C-terminal domain-containing protein [Bacteroidales bacterium]